MPKYEPIMTETCMRGANVLIRLTHSDSVALLDSLKDGVERDTGLSLVFMDMTNAFSLTYSEERNKQIKCIAFSQSGFRVDSEMKGYNGPWTHVEIVMPVSTIRNMKQFVNNVESIQRRLL